MKKRTSAELKRMARGRLNGRWGLPMGATVLYVAAFSIILLVTTIPFSGANGYSSIGGYIMGQAITLVISLIATVFSAGLLSLYMNFCRGKEAKLSDLLFGFRNHPDRIIIASFLLTLVGLVCEAPVFILSYLVTLQPANIGLVVLLVCFSLFGSALTVILTLGFTITINLLVDHPDMSAIDGLKTSYQLMKGNKWRCFCLSLSFIGWFILSVFTCYIAFLWIMPYMQTTTTYFYLDVIGELDEGTSEMF